MEKSQWNLMDLQSDLALEERERFLGDGGEIPGVELYEWEKQERKIRLTEVIVKDEDGAKAMGKPIGTYITIEVSQLLEKDELFQQSVIKELAEQIQGLLERHDKTDASVLVIGLGNADATPDSLGPRVLERVQVTRQFLLEFGHEFCEKHGYPVISGLIPGVMGKTGMETAEIIRGVVNETKPEVLIVVDALAARSAHRLGVTIQLSDTGIRPGSGVGNHRGSLTEADLGIPVLAIGVPTVIRTSVLIDSVKEPMFVTPHNIDEQVECLSSIISDAIYEALF